MDRVRALIGGRRRGAARERDSARESENARERVHDASPARHAPPFDDQETIFETLNDAQTLNDTQTISDTQTLRTFASENATIGDMQQQGYVNRCPQFCAVRDVCLVSVRLTKGFFAFPSTESYDAYVRNKGKFAAVDPDTPFGVPLLHAVPTNIMKAIFSSKTQTVMKIYRYEIARANVHPSAEVVYSCPNFAIVKRLFCSVAMEDVLHSADGTALNQDSKIKHTLTFHGDSGTPLSSVSMYNINGRRDIDTSIDGLPLRWFGFSSFASPFGSNDIKLLVLDDDMPNLLEPQVQRSAAPVRPLGYLPVWAKYTDVDDSLLSTKRSVHLASLEVKEEAVASPGIAAVPWNTLVLTCMCMLLHDYESRKERRHIHAGTAAAQQVGA
ncbi:hypothetical protein DAKH74_055390 [Maudiozyma humilis]|uniref:Uncharacterized protein n=1 Tax=Maudiozyma humilis TaxID=51915 RepID=A0AAV5S5J4_MAUHU|nr:hypothetical protein DAKH74_055390 [Kazachstania humilis]